MLATVETPPGVCVPQLLLEFPRRSSARRGIFPWLLILQPEKVLLPEQGGVRIPAYVYIVVAPVFLLGYGLFGCHLRIKNPGSLRDVRSRTDVQRPIWAV